MASEIYYLKIAMNISLYSREGPGQGLGLLTKTNFRVLV